MAIEFNCPHCDKYLRTKDDKAGARTKCPDCGEPIQVPDAPAAGGFDDKFGGAPSPPREKKQTLQDEFSEDYGDDEYGSDYGDMRPCPMCGEEISESSSVCEYCGERVGGERPKRSRRTGGSRARERIRAPAIALISVAGLGIVADLIWLGLNALGIAVGRQPGQQQEVVMSGTLNIIRSAASIAISIAVILGAVKMMRLQSFGYAMTANILTLIPCLAPCCGFGLPIGIWGLVVLNDEEVKSAFR